MTTEELRELIAERMKRDPELRAILKRIEAGKATAADSFRYSRIASEIMSSTLSGAVFSLEDREEAAVRVLHDRYADTMEQAGAIQRDLDAKNGLHIQPRKPAFPAERVQQIAHSLVQPDVPDEKIVRRAGSTATVGMSFHDDFVQENARFRSRAGLECYITRKTDGKCCPWCTKLAGRYVYGEEPEDVYHRHDNCGCSVTYENGRKRQDVWSKREWEVPAEDAGAGERVVLTAEQAEKLQKKHQLKALTNDTERAKIKTKEHIPATSEEIEQFIMDMRSLGFTSVSGFEEFSERNALLLEISEDVRKMQNAYPGVFDNIHFRFGLTDSLGTDAYAEFDPHTRTLTLNSYFYNNLEHLVSSYEHDVNKKYHPKGTTYRAIIPHEVGHIVEESLGINNKELAKRFFTSPLSDHFTRKLGDAWLESNLSNYASKFHYDELIAEAFAEYYCSVKPRALCVQIVEYVLRKKGLS